MTIHRNARTSLPLFVRRLCRTASVSLLVLLFCFSGHAHAQQTVHISVLMANDTRLDPVSGFKDGLVPHGEKEEIRFEYDIKNANNRKAELPEMARQIIAKGPDIAVAAGGIEADALKTAAAGSGIPVLFLSVSSSIQRGLSSSMVSPDHNITGIETNDTNLTAKRLWFIKRMLPHAKTVHIFHMPSIVPSVASVRVAGETAGPLGLELTVDEVESIDDIRKAVSRLSRDGTDVILLNPVAPIHGALQKVILPRAMAERIPVFGYGMGSIKNGAFASYAGSRYANGRQAARLAHKIINGIQPEDIPIETPEHLELVINKSMVERLGIQLSPQVWKMADRIVEIPF